MSDVRELLEPIRRLHAAIRDRVVASTESSAVAATAAVARDAAGDTIYALDTVGEHELVEFCRRDIAPRATIVLIAEGLAGGSVVLPRGAREEDAVFRVIVDPIDGTRGLMYQKRSAWILTGVAPNKGCETSLRDIELAVQTEIPLVKQHLSDSAWALRGEGVRAERHDRLTGESRALRLAPSAAPTIAHGFAQIARFFPGARDELAAIEEEVARRALGPVRTGKALYFEDQYVSSGGQLYELMAGHDRFVADLRPLMRRFLRERGEALGICCHPYDLCTELIARELGVIVVDPRGRPIEAPLDLETEIAWLGFANATIQHQIEPLLRAALARRGLLEGA